MSGNSRIGPILCIVAWCLCGTSAFAQGTYPTKSIRLIVPYPPGGGADVMGRVLAEALSARFAQQVVVDNRGGANSPEALARLTPQGFDPEPSTPQHVTQYVKSEVVRYGKLLKSMGLQNL